MKSMCRYTIVIATYIYIYMHIYIYAYTCYKHNHANVKVGCPASWRRPQSSLLELPYTAAEQVCWVRQIVHNKSQSPKFDRCENLFTLLDFRPQIQNLVIPISTISICQNRSISIFSNFGSGGEDN